MVDVIRSFPVSSPPAEVVSYLADFTHAVAWDPGTVRCERVDDGPVQVGARWRNVTKLLGRETEIDYELVTLESDHVVLRGTNKTATSTDDIRVVATRAGSTVTYHAHIVFNGVAKLAEPLMQRIFEKLGDETVEGIQRELGAP
ncbi:SRPBCC family protein [Phycicoccus ginsengisoli]